MIWGGSITESEALRYLKIGAKGIVRKTADIGTFLCCLETSSAEGSTWMERQPVPVRRLSGAQRAARTDGARATGARTCGART